jgi:alpha-mannosidase
MKTHGVRRLLIALIISTMGWLALNAAAQSSIPPAQESWPPQASQYRFHMIGNSHIDAVWLWIWPEGMSSVVSTFRSALERMKDDPEFTFTASSAQFYDWVAATDPKMMEEIRQRVKEGRWDVVGGWWVEPDVNIPNGESLVRQGLYSQRLFQQLFGRQAEIGYNPDSFGHPGTLPQILKLQGLHGYVFMRPQPQEKTLPSDLFWWEGADGTRVLTYHIPIAYGDYAGSITHHVQRIIAESPDPTKDLMAFYGAGDHGGGPTRISIQSILAARKEPGAPAMIFSTPDKYFDEVENLPNLPVVADDLQHHSVGCYTAVSEVKKNNRAAEAALVTGEKFALLGSVVAGSDYPQGEFTSAWKKVLLMQFHDSLAGSALPAHYEMARQAQGYAMEVGTQAMYRAAEKIAWQIPTPDADSEYVVVFNPHAWDANLNAEYELGWEWAAGATPESRSIQTNSSLVDDQGRAIAHQWAQSTTTIDDRKRLVFRAPVPAFGYRQFQLRRVPPAGVPMSQVHAQGSELENEHLRVRFADDGTYSLYDKDAKAEVFGNGRGRAVVLDDPSDTWSHDVKAYTKEIGVFGHAQFHVLENGPLRATLRVRSQYGASMLETDWMLYAGARTLEARVALDWHEHLKILKFSFPVDVQNPQPTYEIAYGYKVRKAQGDEDPGQRWIDVSGERAGSLYGLAVINDAKYGYSVKGGDLRVSIVRSPVFAQYQRELKPDGEYLWQDQGRQTFRMLLVPHAAGWREAGVVRLAEEFTAPVPILYQGIHPGSRPGSASFLAVDAPNVVVSAVKRAEDGDDIIVRCYETEGRATTATLDLALVNRRWKGRFHPLEIKTLRVPRAGGEIREVNVLEQDSYQ